MDSLNFGDAFFWNAREERVVQGATTLVPRPLEEVPTTPKQNPEHANAQMHHASSGVMPSTWVKT